jgi:hypothetical protein
MDSEKQPYQPILGEPMASSNNDHQARIMSEPGPQSSNSVHSLEGKRPEGVAPLTINCSHPAEILKHLHSGNLLIINSKRRNGLIIHKSFHAEFAGPGAAVGGFFDEDCQSVIPVGNLSLVQPTSHEERQNAYLIRRQWIRLTQQFTDNSVPLQRAQMILNQFETYFDQDVIARLPDESFALMVGVLPQTVRMARRPPGKLNVKVRS